MNNEELILQMLTGLTSEVKGIKDEVKGIKDEVKELKADMSDMKKTIKGIDERTTRIELHLENVTDKNISLLMEQHGPITDSIKEGQEKINTLLFDVDNLKRVVVSHSKDINRLLSAK